MLLGGLQSQSSEILEQRLARDQDRSSAPHDRQPPLVDPALHGVSADVEGSRDLAGSQMFGRRGGSPSLAGGGGQDSLESARAFLLPLRAQVAHDFFGEPDVIPREHDLSSSVVSPS